MTLVDGHPRVSVAALKIIWFSLVGSSETKTGTTVCDRWRLSWHAFIATNTARKSKEIHICGIRTEWPHVQIYTQWYYKRVFDGISCGHRRCGCQSHQHNTQHRKGIDLTMVLPLAAAAARRRVGIIAKQQTQRRNMAGAPAPQWEGVDKVVRGYFPQDHQRA